MLTKCISKLIFRPQSPSIEFIIALNMAIITLYRSLAIKKWRFAAMMFLFPFIQFLVSCSPEPQSSPPLIVSVVTTGQEHGDGAHAIAGKTSLIEVTTEDDTQLSQIQCTYTHTGEFHSHAMHGGGLIPAFRAPNIGEWTEIKNKDIDGIWDQSTLKFSVPQSISGAWLLTTSVIDQDGFVSYDELTVIVENDSIPAIIPVATTPAASPDGFIQLSPGETFNVDGNILDENYLSSIDMSISLNGQPYWQETIQPENQWLFDMSEISMPTFTDVGQYEFTLEVTDRHGWKNWVVATIKVENQ